MGAKTFAQVLSKEIEESFQEPKHMLRQTPGELNTLSCFYECLEMLKFLLFNQNE